MGKANLDNECRMKIIDKCFDTSKERLFDNDGSVIDFLNYSSNRITNFFKLFH